MAIRRSPGAAVHVDPMKPTLNAAPETTHGTLSYKMMISFQTLLLSNSTCAATAWYGINSFVPDEQVDDREGALQVGSATASDPTASSSTAFI
jgi:hypothetical protein